MANNGLYSNFFNASYGGLDSGVAINYLTNTIKVGLLTSGYTPNQTGHTHYSDVSANEATGTGYTAGGQTLASKAITVTSLATYYTAANVTWATSTITAAYAFLYNSTGTAGTSALIGLYDFGGSQSSVANNFTLAWNASGLFSLAVAAFS
jgi:hypothetical protein